VGSNQYDQLRSLGLTLFSVSHRSYPLRLPFILLLLPFILLLLPFILLLLPFTAHVTSSCSVCQLLAAEYNYLILGPTTVR
jgi:hypothetical protein